MQTLKLRRRAANALFVGFCGLATLIALAGLAMILWSLITKGIGGLNLDIFTMSTPAPGSRGGLLNAIVGSILQCVVAMVIAVAVGVLAGTWLSEFGGNSLYGRVIRFLNDVLLSAPSILVGVFIWTIVVQPMHSFSGWAGALALALLAVPIVTRTTEDMLKLQPTARREAGMALGASQWFTIRKVIWRAAGAGLLTGGLLGFARISGETAPLMQTSLGNQFFQADMAKPMASLPLTIYAFALSPEEDWIRLAWVASLLITVAVLTINILGRWLAGASRHE
jgi:phosphate transport system permease protein